MFANDITIGTSTYSLVSIENARSVRSNAAAPLGQPDGLVISHQVVKRPSGVADRHLIRIDRSFAPLPSGVCPVISGQLVIEVPRDGVLGTDAYAVAADVASFIVTSGVATKLFNSEP
jgi:hypothetical protein